MRRKKLRSLAAAVLAGGSLVAPAYGASFTGPSSSQSPYVTPTAAGVDVTSILTVGDAVGGYAMVGIPDGLGAYDNGDETFTLLMNHELPAALGDVRAHGATGAFVSEWVIRKSDFGVVSGRDLATSHQVWDPGTMSYAPAAGLANQFGRLCSADLPAVSAFYDSASGKGTQNRIYMNGEEVGAEGRGYAFLATGAGKGTAYELPALGKFSWENSVANPYSGEKTVVVGLDDSTPGQVYVYMGDKATTGNDIELAGLTSGSLFGVKTPVAIENGPLNSAFTLQAVNAFQSGGGLQAQSNALGVTNFARPEDGHWADVDTFYFVTTGADPDNNFPTPMVNGPIPTQSSRLYRMDFASDYSSGQLSMVLDAASLTGTDGATARTFDNMVVGDDGKVYVQEDPGSSAYIAKTWQYDPANGLSTQLLESDRARFFDPVIEAPTNVLPAGILTIDEESSGIIDVTAVLGRNDGKRYFMADMQAHYSTGASLIEGGQLYAFSLAIPEPSAFALCGLSLACLVGASRRK